LLLLLHLDTPRTNMSIRELSQSAAAHSDAIWSVDWSSVPQSPAADPAAAAAADAAPAQPAQQQLLTGGVDELLKVWSVSGGGADGGSSLKVDSKPRLTASGQTILSAQAQAEGQVLPLSASLSLLSVVSVPNSSLVVTSSMDGLLRVYDVSAQGPAQHVRRIEAGALESWTICVDPSGQFVAAGSRSGSVHVFSLASGERLATLLGERAKESEAAAAWAMSVAWSRDGRHLAAGHYDGRVSLWHMQGAVALAPARPLTPHSKAVRALRFSADSALLFSGADDMHVHWYDVSDASGSGAGGSGQLVHDLFAHGSWVTAIDLPFASTGVVPPASAAASAASAAASSPLAASTFVSVSTDRKVKVWSLATRECIATHELDSAGWCVAFSPEGDKIAVGTEQGTLAIFQVPTQ
jgi:WD40 repeat protein